MFGRKRSYRRHSTTRTGPAVGEGQRYTTRTLYAETAPLQPLTPRPDDVTALVRVPVLILLGAEDFYYDRARLAEEPSHFPSAPVADLLLLERTGHAVFHHLNHDEVHAGIGAWLDARGL